MHESNTRGLQEYPHPHNAAPQIGLLLQRLYATPPRDPNELWPLRELASSAENHTLGALAVAQMQTYLFREKMGFDDKKQPSDAPLADAICGGLIDRAGSRNGHYSRMWLTEIYVRARDLIHFTFSDDTPFDHPGASARVKALIEVWRTMPHGPAAPREPALPPW